MAIKAEYIWVDGTEPTAKLRSKTKILEDGTKPTVSRRVSRARIFITLPTGAGQVQCTPGPTGGPATRPRRRPSPPGA